MPKISQYSLQENWYRINKNKVLELIYKYYPSEYLNQYHAAPKKPTLAKLLKDVAWLDFTYKGVPAGSYEEFNKLMQVIAHLPDDAEIKVHLMNLIAEPAPVAPARTNKTAYQLGFEEAAKRREIAKKNGLKWYLEHQRKSLEKLRDLAWWGKIRAVMYGLAVGTAMYGFMLLLSAGQLGVAATAILGITMIPFLAYFPAKANFWITRRDPTELSFDELSPHEPTQVDRLDNDGWSDRTYRNLNTPFLFGLTVKECLARVGGFLNATVYGGLTATGMWEFFTEIGLNSLYSSHALTIGAISIPYAAIPCAVITLAMSRMVFKPELGLGVKFIRSWLNKNPIQMFREMNDRVNPNHELTNPYFLRFLGLFSCIVVGGVFTSLAAADLVGTLTGWPGYAVKLGLSFLTISIVPFYYGKAVDNVVKTFKKDLAILKSDAGRPDDALAAEPEAFTFPWWVRRLNALVHAVPAALGGLATFSGLGGVAFGLFTGLAGFGASFISGENGEEKGYEDEIENEHNATVLALNDPAVEEWVADEPQVVLEDGRLAKATEHPYLLSMFNSSRETQGYAIDLLDGRMRTPRV